jgi:hypothetical protein
MNADLPSKLQWFGVSSVINKFKRPFHSQRNIAFVDVGGIGNALTRCETLRGVCTISSKLKQ